MPPTRLRACFILNGVKSSSLPALAFISRESPGTPAREAVRSRRLVLCGGVLLMLGGLTLLALFPRLAPLPGGYQMEPLLVWPVAIGALMISTLRRCLIGVADPSPRRVQAAVRQCLFSLIVLDAGIALLVASWASAVGVLALLIPTLVLGRWINAT